MQLSRRSFIRTSLAGVAWITCGALPSVWAQTAKPAVIPWTTFERTVIPVPVSDASPKIAPNEIHKFAQYGYGQWQEGQGLPMEKRYDLMPRGYSGAKAKKAARLVRFFAISDIHLTDKESPAQVIFWGLQKAISSAYSPVMMCTPHVLDAAVRTVNALHKQDSIDFGISLGDACNSTQYNELRWYLDILDGKAITPSSGAHAGADTIDYQKPFQAVGLDTSIPWYQALGNHDQFWMGTAPVDDHLRQVYVGEQILDLGNIFTQGVASRGIYMGTLDGNTPNGEIIGMGPVSDFPSPPRVAADPDRRSLLRKQWMGEFFNTSSKPVGHGFSQENLDQDFGCYSFAPKSDLPLKIIVLDNTQKAEDPNAQGFTWHGTVDQKRWEWLVSELDKGQAEGQLMVIACHIPIGVEKPGANMSWWSKAYVSEEALFAKLHEYPNLILWMAGHRHFNTVTAFASPDPKRPELGFWQVETSSLRDFPQQFRMFEIIRNSDDTVSILTTNVDPLVEEGSLAARSRSYAVAAHQIIVNSTISSNPGIMTPTGSYNAELVVLLTPAMQAKIKGLGAPVRS
ncbi:MAG: hypothetical protein FD177_806 [Desulfovibrionaceae bacterium]|nr:MAG: hypothetical protein FD177_806 [Desulfovibrionaceae bacterium]